MHFFLWKIEINLYFGLALYVTRLRMLQVGAGRRKCKEASEIHKFSTVLQRSLFESYDTFTSLVLSQGRCYFQAWMNAICPDESEFTLGPIQENISFCPHFNFTFFTFWHYVCWNYDTFDIYGAEMEWTTIFEMPTLGTIDWWKKGQNSLVTPFPNMANSTK